MNYEAKVRYVKIDANSGKEKQVSETYLLDAETFGHAEQHTLSEMAKVTNATVVATIKKSDIIQVIGDADSSKFYKSVVKMRVIDELTGKESVTTESLLVGCDSLKESVSMTEDYCKQILFDNEITKVSISSIVGIL